MVGAFLLARQFVIKRPAPLRFDGFAASRATIINDGAFFGYPRADLYGNARSVLSKLRELANRTCATRLWLHVEKL
jgi:hypothetical protein